MFNIDKVEPIGEADVVSRCYAHDEGDIDGRRVEPKAQ